MKIYRRNSALQKIVTFDTLATFAGGSGIGTTDFKVPIPDSRLRVKLSILYILPGNTAVSNLSSTLWLREADEDASGVTGALIPLADIEGTSAAPTAIPSNTALLGYSREFISAADYIVGTFATLLAPSALGSWVLQCRYQPQAVRFTDEEWEEIAANCNPSVPVIKI